MARQIVSVDDVTRVLPTEVMAANFGDAAPKDTGTTAGTVAAGDDSRIVGALPAAGLDAAAANLIATPASLVKSALADSFAPLSLTAAAPVLTSLPVVAETVVYSVSGYDSATGTYYGHSTANGHFITSTDLNTWTDHTYSPSVYTPPGLVGWVFDEAYMYGYTITGKSYRAVKGAFNAWTEITVPNLGPLTTGRVGVLCALGAGVLLYGNYTSTGGDGAHVWRSSDAGTTWTEVMTLAAAKHIHAIRKSPTTGWVWCSVGDANFAGIGLYRSTDGGASWVQMSGNVEYGIDMVFLPAAGRLPDLVVLEGDGLNRPHLVAFPEHGTPGDDTFPLTWGWNGPATDPLAWRGTTRGLCVLPNKDLIYYTTPEAGATGTRAGLWLAQAPDYQRVILLRDTTAGEPNYGATFANATYVQNLQRRYPTPTLGTY